MRTVTTSELSFVAGGGGGVYDPMDDMFHWEPDGFHKYDGEEYATGGLVVGALIAAAAGLAVAVVAYYGTRPADTKTVTVTKTCTPDSNSYTGESCTTTTTTTTTKKTD